MEKSPDAFKTISEAADELGVEQHVLRFWETKFPQIKPLKRRGGRRYYRPEDMEVLRHIQQLLHQQGYTIKGAKKALSHKGEAPNVAAAQPAKGRKKADPGQLDLLASPAPAAQTGLSKEQRKNLTMVLKHLQSMRKRLQSAA